MFIAALMSHPSRVRGLKLQELCQKSSVRASHPSRVRGLKPFDKPLLRKGYLRSHPSRVRGLKQAERGGKSPQKGSHPSRVRGLKQGVCLL